MIITYENLEKLHEINLHDGFFSGFCYDYEKRKIDLQIDQPNERMCYSFVFYGVVAIQMQSCCFWGPTNRVYDMWVDDEPKYYENLLALQTEKADLYSGSYLDCATSHISIVIQLISGDDLRIACEKIHVEESAMLTGPNACDSDGG